MFFKIDRYIHFHCVSYFVDENGKQLCSSFITLPSKRKSPEYYQRILDPIDLETIDHNINTGVYKTAEAFDLDMIKVFSNAVKFYGRTSELGIAATRLKKVYNEAKQKSLHKFEDVLGQKPPAAFTSKKSKSKT